MESVVRMVVEPFFENIIKRLNDLDTKLNNVNNKITKIENNIIILESKIPQIIYSSHSKMEEID